MKHGRKISIAYSPDTDDAFMIEALRSGRLAPAGFDFEFIAADIQELNERARDGVYDITAISVAAYPLLAEHYMLMPIGSSVGDAFGPAVVTNGSAAVSSLSLLAGKRIAVPGLATSAYLASLALIGSFEAVAMPFFEISDAVKEGRVDAGVLIHELQMRPETVGLTKVADLGAEWHKRFSLPLPLGANAIKRNLGPEVMGELGRIYRRSIELGLASRRETLERALAASGAALGTEDADRYIEMYVNESSLAVSKTLANAMQLMFDIGGEHGLFAAPRVSDHLLAVPE